MPEPEPTHPDSGATVELELSDRRSGLPAERADLREQLPGLEAERHVTDWGRSERVEGLVDRTVYEFLYHYWFRVAVEGLENVSDEGAGLLVANHSGAVPWDGAMIAKAVKEEHARARVVHLTTEQSLSELPGLGMLVTKLGGVAAHPANLHRLLFDEGQLVLVFPEGRSAALKPLKERYRLHPFDRTAFVEAAMRAGAPILPVAVLGAEEALPVLASMKPLRGLIRLPRLPLSTGLPLPAKFRLRFLEPVQTDDLGRSPWRDRQLVTALGADIRALIQENLLEMVAGRRSVWLG